MFKQLALPIPASLLVCDCGLVVSLMDRIKVFDMPIVLKEIFHISDIREVSQDVCVCVWGGGGGDEGEGGGGGGGTRGRHGGGGGRREGRGEGGAGRKYYGRGREVRQRIHIQCHSITCP